MLADGENRLGGMTFWVPSGREHGRGPPVACAPSSTRRRTRACSGTPRRRPSRSSATPTRAPPTGAPMADLAGTANLSGAANVLDADRARRRSSSRSAPVGTLGAVKVAEQWRRATDTAASPTDTVHRRQAAARTSTRSTTARAYGNVYWRLRLGAPAARRWTAPRGIVVVLDSHDRLQARRATSPSPTAATAAATRSSPRRRRASPSVVPLASAKSFSCIDGLGRYVGREINAYDIALTAPDPGTLHAGRGVHAERRRVHVTLPAVMLKGLYGNLVNYECCPTDGHRRPAAADLGRGRRAPNTAEGVQIVLVDGRWQADFNDPDGIPATGDESLSRTSSSATRCRTRRGRRRAAGRSRSRSPSRASSPS